MISIIVATDKKGAIGKDNALLWHLPNDLKRFKAITSGHPIIMGRKTYESIGRPLPNRRNIVITTNKALQLPGCEMVNSLAEAMQITAGVDAFVVGGGQIYKEAMPYADMIYLTLVDTELDADTHFPNIPSDKWEEVFREKHQSDEKHLYNYEFIDYKKR